MRRREFLLGAAMAPMSGGVPATGPAPRPPSRFSHRIPPTDRDIARNRWYIEDPPVPEYRWAPDDAYEAFLDLKYGVRIHWGLYSIWKLNGESWPFLQMPHEKRQQYQELYRNWKPQGFDATQWMELFAECGMKMFAFTTKHHDGFSMFDTRTRVRQRVNWTAPGGPKVEPCDVAYSIMETPFRRDVVGELCKAARRRGIKIDLYFSHSDWYDADFRPYGYHPLQTPSAPRLTNAQLPGEPSELERARKRLGERLVMAPDPTPEETRRMLLRHRTQLTELLTRYGSIDMLCLDIWLGPTVWPQLRETLLHLRRLQPNVMLRARGIGNYGDYYTPEGFVPGSKENTDAPWFVIHKLGTSFSYDAEAKNYKGAGWIVRNLVDAVSKGGNFMVGIGPDGDGRFHPTAIEQIREAGVWLKINGEGIFATRPREGDRWREGEEIRFTRSKDGRVVYAFALQWPGRTLILKTVSPPDGSRMWLLGWRRPVRWRRQGDGVEVEIPAELQNESRRPCRFAWALKVEAAKKA